MAERILLTGASGVLGRALVAPLAGQGALHAVARRCDVADESEIAALYIEPDGVYANQPGIDAWCEMRDARCYAGPYPVVAHPPCQRWGRFWHGSTRKPHQFALGDDGGCFAAALASLRAFGGVLEHPADSRAWQMFGIPHPKRGAGWLDIGGGGWTCYVQQGQYGHLANKGTWLLYYGQQPPFDLNWTIGEQRLDPVALAKHGYKKASRIGIIAMMGGKDKTKKRKATPIAFRDALIKLANHSKF
jgi:hypothetical protein